MSSVDQIKATISNKGGLARPNNFLVQLPTDFYSAQPGSTYVGDYITGSELNILCQSVSVPPKTVLTLDQRMGMTARKVAYGYQGAGSVNMTFLLLNDYGIRKYFDSWYYNTVIEEGVAVYFEDYAKDIRIHQLKKAINPKNSAGQLSDLQGGIVYSALLQEAYPTNITQTEFTNDLDGTMQLTVEFTYTKWEPLTVNPAPAQKPILSNATQNVQQAIKRSENRQRALETSVRDDW